MTKITYFQYKIIVVFLVLFLCSFMSLKISATKPCFDPFWPSTTDSKKTLLDQADWIAIGTVTNIKTQSRIAENCSYKGLKRMNCARITNSTFTLNIKTVLKSAIDVKEIHLITHDCGQPISKDMLGEYTFFGRLIKGNPSDRYLYYE